MVYDFFVKIFGGVGVSSVIVFLFLNADFSNGTLKLNSQLQTPITIEISELIQKGFEFRIEYYMSIILRGRKTYRVNEIKSLSFKEGVWMVNNEKSKSGSCPIISNNFDFYCGCSNKSKYYFDYD